MHQDLCTKNIIDFYSIYKSGTYTAHISLESMGNRLPIVFNWVPGQKMAIFDNVQYWK